MAVVVVESPAKAKTINQYLGPGYTVLASYGHVRDLPAKDGSVDPDQDFAMKWEVAPESQKHVRAIAEALKDDGKLILATDPDREGEAISWHLLQALTGRKAVKKDTEVARVAFNAITRAAVNQAMENPRQIDMELVDAYLARRALDYLVGFRLSPVLWRKLPGAKSAGRVQSVALRLIVEREMEIEAFRAREYWTVKALLATPRGDTFEARLVTPGRPQARQVRPRRRGRRHPRRRRHRGPRPHRRRGRIEARHPQPGRALHDLHPAAGGQPQVRLRRPPDHERRPAPLRGRPHHLHAHRRHRHGARGGHGRPRGHQAALRRGLRAFLAAHVQEQGEERPGSARVHPADRHGPRTRTGLRLEPDQWKLYDLIWKRSVASQMEAARFERTTVDVTSADKAVGLRATGQVVTFDGFLKVYLEGRDDDDIDLSDDGDGGRLPQIVSGEPADKRGVTPEQHFTQPPPRYTEATLVKRMEELGIGRPSTYASIVSTIQEREYVRKDKNRLFPEDKGRLVTAFLANYFGRYVDYDFTADLEEDLDRVTTGEEDWKALLARFWKDFSAALRRDRGPAHHRGHGEDQRGAGAAPLPEDRPRTPSRAAARSAAPASSPSRPRATARPSSAAPTTRNAATPARSPAATTDDAALDGKLLGMGTPGGAVFEDDAAEQPVTLHKGPYGYYVQLGEAAGGAKPPRASIPKGMDPATLALERALELLSLPRQIGTHPEDGQPVEAGIGRYGPYVKHGKIYANLRDPEEVFTIGMNRAVELLAQKSQRGGRGAAATPLRELGEHPDGGAVALYAGRYGPYVKWEKVNATLPKEIAPEAVTLEQALELVAAKAPKGGKRPARKAAGGKGQAKAAKPAAKKRAGAS